MHKKTLGAILLTTIFAVLGDVSVSEAAFLFSLDISVVDPDNAGSTVNYPRQFGSQGSSITFGSDTVIAPGITLKSGASFTDNGGTATTAQNEGNFEVINNATTGSRRQLTFTITDNFFMSPGTSSTNLTFFSFANSYNGNASLATVAGSIYNVANSPNNQNSNLNLLSPVTSPVQSSPLLTFVRSFQQFSITTTITMTLANGGTDVKIDAGSKASASATPVPAPASACLALAGLPLIGIAGWYGRREKRHQAAELST